MHRKDLLRTLFSRMLVVYMTVVLILIAVMGITVVFLLRMQSVGGEQEKIRTELLQAQQIEEKLLTGEITDEIAASDLSVLAYRAGTMVDVYPVEGKPEHYYSNDKWETVANSPVPAEELNAYIISASNGNTETDDFFKEVTFPTISKYTIIPESGKAQKLIAVHADTSACYQNVRDTILVVVLVLLVGALACVIAVYYTTNSVIRPVREVNEIVQRYSRGDYNARIPISNTQEATQLALSFNQMADQLKDLEETRRSFVANVSHELRSPLTSMKGFLEAMEDGTIPVEERDEYIGIVLAETRRMALMVNDLLDLARIESGKTSLHLETFDINELVRRTLLTFEARIYERRMDVEIKFAQEQCFVEADSAQISQVLRNLIDNAIKYSPEDSKLRIATYALRHEVYVSVQDFGQGIPEEDVPHIFERFYKVEKARTPSKQSGTGLGLSIVKRIIDQHGQRITINSTKGKGTTFLFTLKRVPTPKRQRMEPEE